MKAELIMPIRDRLRAIRLGKNMTQQEVASAAGLSLSSVTQIEYGLIPDPRLSTVQAIARALKCGMDELAPADDPAPAAKKRGTRRK
jgi:transcriptional regulator with XRE-family HTH domain